MNTLQNLLDEFNIKGYFSIKKACEFSEKCFSDQYAYYDEYLLQKSDAIALACKIIGSPSSGKPEHYHNYAVVLAREDEYTCACDIIIQGMKTFESNTDLLADFLLYAIKSSNEEHYRKCEDVFSKLQSSRPHFWTWRSYCFSIEFLLDKLNRNFLTEENRKKIKEQCLSLARECQKRIPDDENGYLAEANIYETYNDKKMRFRLLEKAVSKHDVRLVRISSILAEYYIQNKMPEKAIQYSKRALTDLANIEPGVTPAYVYILLVMSKISQFIKNVYSDDMDICRRKSIAQEILDDWGHAKANTMSKNEELFKVTQALIDLVTVIGQIEQIDEL